MTHGNGRGGNTTAGSVFNGGTAALLAPGITARVVPMRDWSRDEVDFCVVGAGARRRGGRREARRGR